MWKSKTIRNRIVLTCSLRQPERYAGFHNRYAYCFHQAIALKSLKKAKHTIRVKQRKLKSSRNRIVLTCSKRGTKRYAGFHNRYGLCEPLPPSDHRYDCTAITKKNSSTFRCEAISDERSSTLTFWFRFTVLVQVWGIPRIVRWLRLSNNCAELFSR